MKEETTPQAGDILADKYRVKQVLGAGGMGVVVSAEHVQLGQTVALKFLHPDAFAAKTALERFLREARASAKLKSEHVVRVTDVGTLDTGAPYMVMEHLSGTDLAAELARRERLPLDEALGYLLQACEGIAEAHAAGIVHRDLKPSNLFLTKYPDGSPLVKVLDFGVSKTLSNKTDLEPSLTGTAELMGSPRYMSPEQIRVAKHLDARSDVWSLGVILYELLVGRVPFDGDSLPELLAQIAADPPAPLADASTVLPAGLEAVVMRCLEKNRDDRYASVADLAIALAPYASRAGRASIARICAIAGLPEDASPPSVMPVPAPTTEPAKTAAMSASSAVHTATGWGTTHASAAPQAKRWPLFAAAGAAVALLAIVGIFAASRSGGVAPTARSEVIASVVAPVALMPAPSAQPAIAPSSAAPSTEPSPAVATPPAPAASAARRAAPAPAAKPGARPARPAKTPGISGLLDGRE